MARRENFEDDSFEREWKETFEHASEQPDKRVWGNIERELAFKQLAVLQRKAHFYKWTAAAAIFVAAFFGINYFISDELVQKSSITNAVEKPESFTTSSDDLNEYQVDNNTEVEEISTLELSKSNGNNNIGTGATQNSNMFIISDNDEDTADFWPPSKSYEEISLSKKSLNQSYIAHQIYSDPERKMYKKPINAKFVKKSTRKLSEDRRFWAGVGVGSGSFDPNYQSGATNLLASSLNLATAENYSIANTARIDNQSPTVREGMKGGSSIDMGLNFGIRLSENWLLESGVFYTQSDAITQTNVVVASPNVVEPIAASSETRGVTQLSSLVSEEKLIQYDYQDVSLNNQFQFASFPLKAGYILVDRRLNIVVNAGVSTNLYLGNKLIDPNSEVANVSIGPGDTSPYREVSFAGLGSLQVGYSIFDQVSFTVEPYLRHPITSLTKENTTFNAAPSGIGINTGIRYRFN